jgi:chromosome partitioning protein
MADRGTILVFGGQKGGIGKSTQATNFAVEIARQGADVIIVDTDPQKTSINWVDRRNEAIESGNNIPKVNGISKEGNVRDTLKDLSQRYDVVIVDAAGRDSKSLRTALTISDIVICPIKPSQADLETLPHLCEVIDAAKDINPKLVSYGLISMSPTHPFSDESGEAKKILNDFSEHLLLLNGYVSERKVYRDALLLGKGVVEMNNYKASVEVKKVVEEVFNGK